MVDQLITDAGFQQRVIPRIPLRRWGLPEDLAGAAVYLNWPREVGTVHDIPRLAAEFQPGAQA